jgi:uncharacterized protein involved in tellurium resistance
VGSPNGGTQSGNATTGVLTINLNEGENVTCTFTNTRQAATLTVIKHVVNDNGGTATASDFTMTVTGGSPSPASFAGAESPGTAVTLTPNTAYSVDESSVSGYTKTGASAGCASATGIPPGGTATCTITNDDQAATLKVIKHVVNDDGGSATAGNWSIHVKSGANEVSGSPQPGAEAPGTSYTLSAGTYAVSETGAPSGYTFDGFSGDCNVSGSVTLALGETKTCTLTNNDQQATITVVKFVNNDHGGTAAPDDFKLTLDGNATTSGTAIDVNPGTYTAGETLLDGYTFDGFSGDCDTDGKTTVALGEHKTCTLTNSDNGATLIVIKHVINDNGGTKTAGDFTMNVTATNPSDDSFPGAESPGTSISLSAGSYSVDETDVAGYTKSIGADCSGTIANGETKTCTITNDDNAQVRVQITPTATTCDTFNNGTSADLTQVNYSVRNGKISQVDPGVFFYWIKVDATVGSNTFTIHQNITTGNFSTYFTKAAGSAVFTSSCVKLNSASITQAVNSPDTLVTFNASTAGTYIIGIKYDTGAVKGQNAPSPTTTVHYDFSTNGVSGSTDGLDLVKKA